MEKKSGPPSKKKQVNDYVKYSTIAFQMIATVAIGVFAGIKLDEHFQTDNAIFTLVFTLVFVLIGILIGVRGILKDR